MSKLTEPNVSLLKVGFVLSACGFHPQAALQLEQQDHRTNP